MQVNKELVLKLFQGASMQRWNNKMRPIEFTELDKQAHKMTIAYLLGKLEEKRTPVDWVEIIEGGIFELLQRTVLTDLRPQLFYKIKADREQYQKLNEWAFAELEPAIAPLGEGFCQRFRNHLSTSDDTLGKRILSGAHFFATKWEFKFIEQANPDGFEIDAIRREILADNQKYYDIEGIKELILYPRYNDFINLSGELRFQLRWSTIPRVPKTSVLGHMLLVAILSYLFSLHVNACRVRRINNYFTGLFHDLPEVLTRDIISPVKKSTSGLAELIKQYEKEEMDRQVYSLLDSDWHDDIRRFTQDEFANTVIINGKVVHAESDEIQACYNADAFSARDGELVKAADVLCAFVEAYTSSMNGISAPELSRAMTTIKAGYSRKTVAGACFGDLLAEFD